ncbi:MAG: 30S ribosomal protein S18, partial [Chloroflexi bacterium]|nr:30S ribosomal protein S18 [Chloroflexota bacterium]
MTPPRTTQDAAGRPPFRRGGARRRRQCYCKESTVDYKDVSSIRRFITDRGRIEAGKKSGNCAKCQRNLTTAIKRARHLALLPYAPDHLRVTGNLSAGGNSSSCTQVIRSVRKQGQMTRTLN